MLSMRLLGKCSHPTLSTYFVIGLLIGSGLGLVLWPAVEAVAKTKSVTMRAAQPGKSTLAKEDNLMTFEKPSEAELRQQLSPEQFRVSQQCGTEPAFHNAYWDNKEAGIYVDVVSGEALFSSTDKFDSGTGWPSFTQAIQGQSLLRRADPGPFGQRVEVRSAIADSHLGHVFQDGPAPGGERFCINSASLRFVPVAAMRAEGYEKYLPLFQNESDARLAEDATEQQIFLAAGCFWGAQEILRKLDGVIETEVGYIGGDVENPTYGDVKTGRSGHAEAVRVRYDSTKLTTAALLDVFFRLHDPTTLNRQGHDVGTQYRSAIFYTTAEQRSQAVQAKQRAQNSGRWKSAVTTEIVSAPTFYPAESYHQDYLQKNPGGYSCHFIRD